MTQPFEVPQFTFWNVVFTGAGAAVCWGVKGRNKLKSYALAGLVEQLVTNESARYVIEFCLFVTLGSAIAIAFADPVNARQAVAAGLAWTGLCSTSAQELKVPKQKSSLPGSAQ